MSLYTKFFVIRNSHINRSSSCLNSLHTVFHIVRSDRDRNSDFLLVGVVGVQAWREMVNSFNFPEGAMAVTFLEHAEVG